MNWQAARANYTRMWVENQPPLGILSRAPGRSTTFRSVGTLLRILDHGPGTLVLTIQAQSRRQLFHWSITLL